MTDEFGPDIVVDNLNGVEATAVIDCLYAYTREHKSFQRIRKRISSAMIANPTAWDFTKADHAQLTATIRWVIAEQKKGRKIGIYPNEYLENCEKKLWDAYRECA